MSLKIMKLLAPIPIVVTKPPLVALTRRIRVDVERGDYLTDSPI